MCVCVCVCVVCVYVYVSTLKAINNYSGVIETPYDWLTKFYSFYMAAIISNISRHGLIGYEVQRENQCIKSKIVLDKLLLSLY